MLRIEDIDEALDQDDIPTIEDAFRALVGFPHEEDIDGAETADALMQLLLRVCEALKTDDNQLPNGTVQILKAAMAGRYDALLTTYAAGARFVQRTVEPWRERLSGAIAGTE